MCVCVRVRVRHVCVCDACACVFVRSFQLNQTLDPVCSLRVDSEQAAWRRKVREGREREARQALMLHKLQNKVPCLTY